ncbi:MAG: leucine-rich repeat protein, partial [Clostridia bacterium]|nr:leucine-rich repeat protein [Clostridia bacterium]
LTSVTIPDSVTNIGSNAFAYCSSSLKLYGYKGSIAEAYANNNGITFVDILALITVTPPTKTEYFYKDSLDTEGMVVTAHHIDGTTRDVTAEATVDVSVLDKLGAVTVTVTYKKHTAAFDVTVIPKLESVTVTSPTRTEYVIGDTLDVVGMVVTANYNDGSSVDVTAEASVDVTALDTLGTVTVTVTYKEHTATFDVKVYVEMGKLNESVVYKLGADGYLEITGEGKMPDYLDEFAPWYTYRDDIKTVTVSEGITSIGAYSFFCCSYIEALEIPSTVTVIGESAFSRCFAITSLTLPSGVTSIGAYAFSGCKSLTALEIPKGVFEIGEKAFNNCTSLTVSAHEDSYSLTYAKENEIPYIIITKVLEVVAGGEIGELIWEFDNFNVLTVKGEGAIPNYTRTETAPWYEYRKQITSIVVENGITSIGNYAFYNLAKATSITISDSVDYLGIQFIRGTGITELSVNARTISANAFGRADNLVTLTIGEGFENALGNIFYSETLTVKAPENSYAYGYIELYAEKYPKSQATVTLEADGVAKNKVVRFGYMGDNAFYAMYENAKGNWKMVVSGAGEMKNFPYISDKNKAKGYTFCPTYYMVEEGVETKIYAIELLDGITTIGNCAFYKCTKATSIVIPDSVTSIGQNAFWVCARLKTITLPETVTEIKNNAFNGCTALTSINIPNAVTTIGDDIFVKCNEAGLTVKTSNSFAVRYLINNYNGITVE